MKMKRTALVIAAAAATVWMSGCSLDVDDAAESTKPQPPVVETITKDTSADTVSNDTADTDAVTETTQTAETSADTAGSDQSGNADKEIQKDTEWITVEDSYVTDAGSWTAKDFEKAERFTIKADGTWSCEAAEGDLFKGETGTWSKSAGDKIIMEYPDGGTANRGCSIQFTDPDKGEAELLTAESKCLLIRNDTECGTIADQLFSQMIKDSGQ